MASTSTAPVSVAYASPVASSSTTNANTRKRTKEKEARIKVRAAMRRMAKLVAATEGVERVAELFLVLNYYALEYAILYMCGIETDKPRLA